MQTTDAQTAQTWEAPGPGSWQLDATHFARPVTRYGREVFRLGFYEGFRDFTSRYGLFIDHVRYEYVNRFAYNQVVPVAPEEIPARIAAAAETIATKRWLADAERWETEAKPRTIDRQLALLQIDVDALSTSELVDHLEELRENLHAMEVQHHVFNGSAMLPIAMLMMKAAGWGVPPAEAVALARGAAPESAGIAAGLDDLLHALREDAGAAALLDAARPAGEILDELRSRPGVVGDAASRYLDLVSYRLLGGLDLAEPCVVERPEALVESLRRRLSDDAAAAPSGPSPDALARVRDRIPEEHRAEFGELLDDVLATYRIRDERGLYSDVWALGILRRAVLSAGARLVAAGRIDDPAHLAEAGHDEICSLLLGEGGPPAEELAGRARERAERKAIDAPAWLGDEPQGPPPLDGLPPEAALVNGAIGMAMGALFQDSQEAHEERLVRGIAAAPGVYEGTARLLAGPAQIERLEQGDVLVVPSTTEAFNLALPIIGAIVTNSGGLLSHAAIVSREYGIPSVVGTREATRLIPDGARVRVDGNTGEVTVLG